jgi:hypothetical protein
VLESTKAEVLVAAEKISNPDQLDLVVRKKFGLRSTTVDAPAWPQRLVAAFSRV